MGEGTPILAILNPAAGSGRARRRSRRMIRDLRTRGLEVEVKTTAQAGDGGRLASEAFRRGVRRFLVIGGDGTAFEVLNGFLPPSLEEGARCSLALLPLGTGNSFLQDLTGGRIEPVIRDLVANRARATDVLRLVHDEGELYFLGSFSFGFPADLVALANRRLKWLGRLSYTVAVVLHLPRARPLCVQLVVDGRVSSPRRLMFLFVNNNPTVGGNMLMAPEADPFDGRADLLQVDELGRMELLRTFPQIFEGRHVRHPAVSTSRMQTLELLDMPRLNVLLDGEVLRLVPRRIEILPGAAGVSGSPPL